MRLVHETRNSVTRQNEVQIYRTDKRELYYPNLKVKLELKVAIKIREKSLQNSFFVTWCVWHPSLRKALIE